jgi:hypothetical protein
MKLSNLGKIAAGILIFVVLITFIFWYGKGKTLLQPVLSLDNPAIAQLKDKSCVEDTAFMRTNHMKLLVTWREAVVREGNRHYTATDGRIFETKLSGTCLKCHSNKQQFCDRCHNYVGAKPNCFSCHIIPAEVRK